MRKDSLKQLFFSLICYFAAAVSKRRIKESDCRVFYVLSLHGAGDYLLATRAVALLRSAFPLNNITVLVDRPETEALCQLNKYCSGIECRMLETAQYFEPGATVICLTAPHKLARNALFRHMFKNHFIGFHLDFRVRSNIYSTDRTNHQFSNHISRNDFVVQTLLEKRGMKFDANKISSIAFSNDLLAERSRNLTSDKYDFLLYFPQDKPIKAWPSSYVHALKSLLAGARVIELAFGSDDTLSGPHHDHYTFSSWPSLFNIISRSRVIICSDSVVVYLAQLLRRKTVAIYGATNPSNYLWDDFVGTAFPKSSRSIWCYYGAGYKKCRRSNKCTTGCSELERITPDEIAEAAQALLIGRTSTSQATGIKS